MSQGNEAQITLVSHTDMYFNVFTRFICMRIKKYFYVNGFALSLAMKQRLKATQK